MTTHTPDIRTLLARRKPDHSLEAPFYLDPSIFDLDIEFIFSKHWLYVASEPSIPEAGDYVTVDIGKTSVLIVQIGRAHV